MSCSTSINLTSVVQNETFQLVLKPHASTETPSSLLTNFGQLLIKYGSEQDSLSKSLRQIGQGFVAYAVHNCKQPPSDILRGAIERIKEMKGMLENPFGSTSMKEPWLVCGVAVWDKTVVEQYRAYLRRFSNVELDAKPHAFATEILNWIETIPYEIEEQRRETNLIVESCLRSEEARDYQHFMQLSSLIEVATKMIAKERKLEQSLMLIQDLEKTKLILEKANQEGMQRLNDDLTRQEQSQRSAIGHLAQTLADVRSEQRSTTAHLQEALQINERTLCALKSQLNAAAIQMSKQQDHINQLHSQLNGCYAQLGCLQDEINNSGSCVIV